MSDVCSSDLILVAHFGPESLQQRPATRPELALHPKDFFASHVREMGSLAHRQNVGMARRTEQMVEANLDELSEPLLGTEPRPGLNLHGPVESLLPVRAA